MLVLNKPAGVAVHAARRAARVSKTISTPCARIAAKPSLAHRLDRDTAGCLVLGRHHKALEKLGLLFKQGKIAKTYWAIVVRGPEARRGRSICLSAGSTTSVAGG